MTDRFENPEIANRIDKIEEKFREYLPLIEDFAVLVGEHIRRDRETSLEEDTDESSVFDNFVRLSNELFSTLKGSNERKKISFIDDHSYVRIYPEVFELNRLIEDVIDEFLEKGIDDVVNMEDDDNWESIPKSSAESVLHYMRPKMYEFFEHKIYTFGPSMPIDVRIKKHLRFGSDQDKTDDIVDLVQNIKSRAQANPFQTTEDIQSLINLINEAGYYTEDKYQKLKNDEVFLKSVISFLQDLDNNKASEERVKEFKSSRGLKEDFEVLYRALSIHDHDLDPVEIWDLFKRFVLGVKTQIDLRYNLGYNKKLGDEHPERVMMYISAMTYLKRASNILKANFIK